MRLDLEAARKSIADKVARPLGLSLDAAACGILRVAVANMSRAIRAVSTMHGHTIGSFALMAFGGAGPLHAGDVARECGFRRILIPREPGTLCARGILVADISLDFVRTVMMPAEPSHWSAVGRHFEDMRSEGARWLSREGVAESRRQFRLSVDARYEGQNHEVRVGIEDPKAEGFSEFLESFARTHRREYGHVIEDHRVEIVNCRLQAVGVVPSEYVEPVLARTSLEEALEDRKPVFFGLEEGWLPSPIYRRDRVPAGIAIPGPAVIQEMSATTVLPPGQTAVADGFGNLLVTVADSGREARHGQ